MKKFLLLALTLSILLSTAACGGSRNNNSQSSTASEPEIAQEESGQDEIEDDTEAFETEGVKLQVSLDREEAYTLEDVVGLTVTVTNDSDSPIAYVQGSGSNTVPDALQVDIGGLAPMFRPQMTTSDYGVGRLEPGEKMTFEMPHAPYISNEDNLFAFGTDLDLDFFRDGAFTPAASGEIKGSVEFRFRFIEEGEMQNRAGEPEGIEPILEESVDLPDGDVADDTVDSQELQPGDGTLMDDLTDLFLDWDNDETVRTVGGDFSLHIA